MRHNPQNKPAIKVKQYMRARAQTLTTLVSALVRNPLHVMIESVEDAISEVKLSIGEIENAVSSGTGRLTSSPQKALNDYKALVKKAETAVAKVKSGDATGRTMSEDDVGAMSADGTNSDTSLKWGGAVLRQQGFTAEFKGDENDPMYKLAEEVSLRISDYVQREDISADYVIKFVEGTALTARRSRYTINVSISSSSKADAVLQNIAPLLVAIFDEMDPDFDDDVIGFLMDV